MVAEQLPAPHLVDSEVASGLRRRVVAGRIETEAGWTALDTWRRLGITRYAAHPLPDHRRASITQADGGAVSPLGTTARPISAGLTSSGWCGTTRTV